MGSKDSLDRLHVPRLRVVPAREVRVAHGLGQQPVDHQGVHAVVVEVEVGVGAARLRYDHLLGVEHQAHRSAFAVGQDLLDARYSLVEPLPRGEDAVFRKRRQGPRPVRKRPDQLRGAALYREDLLHIPAHVVGKAEELERLARRRGVEDQGVVAALLVVSPDHQEPEELVHPGQHRQLLGRECIRALPLEQRGHVALYLGPVLLDHGGVIHLLRPQARGHLPGVRPYLRVEDVGERVRRVGAHHEHFLSRKRSLQGRRRGDARLADAALARVEDRTQRYWSAAGSGTKVAPVSSPSTAIKPR